MKKMLFVSIGNIILFILFGLAFAFPMKEVTPVDDFGFSGTVSVFPQITIAWLIVYPILYLILKKLGKLEKNSMSELSFSDEREKIIVSEASKVSYVVLIGGIIVIMAILGGVKFFSVFTHSLIDFYQLSILLLASLLVVATAAYCIKWCIAYKK